MSGDHDFDVVIIGAGLGGSAMLYALHDAGLKILLLERGAHLKQEVENWDPDEVISRNRYDPKEEWLDQDGSAFIPRIYYNVGGSSKFFGGAALRYRRSDFQNRLYPEGESVAWPISYEDLAPYYEEAERHMWVHGKAWEDPQETPRGDYPNPPLEHEADIQWLSDRLAGQGLHPFHLPMAIDQGSTGRCRKGSPCDGFPCKIRAKGDGENSFLRPAVRAAAAGNVQLLTNAQVVRLNHDEDGRRVTSADYETGGQRITVTAWIFVLAAGAANSAALLLRSASPAFPSGMANGSDQVGRNFMAHNNTVLMAFSVFRRNPTRFQKTMAINDFYPHMDGEPVSDRTPAGHIQMRGKVVSQNVRRSPAPLVRLLARFIAARSFDFWVMSEDLPDPENRVTLSAGRGSEATGIRLSRKLNNLAPHRALVTRFSQTLKRIGFPFVIERRPSPRTIQHQCGTLRCGTDPSTSVVDPWCRSHELPNLFVADASVFPSSASVNPALTVAANALRVGARVRQELAGK